MFSKRSFNYKGGVRERRTYRAATARSVEREGARPAHFCLLPHRSRLSSAPRRQTATCRRARSDRARACFPANARLECDPAWGHGHVLGEGQRTPPPRYTRTGRRAAPSYEKESVRVGAPCPRRPCVSARPTPTFANTSSSRNGE